jgi:hypothetical protein
VSGQNLGRCGMKLLLDRLDDEARGSVEAALRRHDITTTAITAQLKKRVNAVPSEFTVRRHRNGKCSCPQQNGTS